ncbi:MAG: inositol-3-phosphate synthase [Actinobacteria bacterium]|nr:inositol-3-phosphate synthase [Actinomycetota bacterium]|tara:strand:- start:8981 stop:10054 length:1074 start_codon:yes stop_codon:yes gene_type:complete
MTDSKIKVAILGVGNCASSFVQGLQYYKDDTEESGLISDVIGGYRVSDIEVVSAFDINKSKVGKDLSEAIFEKPNNTTKFADVPSLNVEVKPGKVLDGIGKFVKDIIEPSDETSNIVEELKSSGAEILINLLPVGSDEAVKFYAECAIAAKVGFINCIPVFIARDEEWYQKFKENNVPLIGDDIKSQVGATIVHRVLAQLFSDRGVNLKRSYQLNVGGNMDFLNMLEEDRLETKRTSKTSSVTSVANKGKGMEPKNVRIGPSDYVEWLEDRKKAFIRLEGESFGGVPLNIEVQLEVWDSPNSAGVVIDAVRYMKYFKESNDLESLDLVSAWLMKAPAKAAKDSETLQKLHELTHQED